MLMHIYIAYINRLLNMKTVVIVKLQEHSRRCHHLKATAMEPSWSLRMPPSSPPTPLPNPKCAPPAIPFSVARVPGGAFSCNVINVDI